VREYSRRLFFHELLLTFLRTLARAKELEEREREDIRHSLEADHSAHRPHRAFSDDPSVNAAATILARDEEERIGFNDFDDDNVDLVIDDDDLSSRRSKSPYKDEFTDNESDIFRDGDGTNTDTYTLHTHVRH
jgi:hypothetical protein